MSEPIIKATGPICIYNTRFSDGEQEIVLKLTEAEYDVMCGWIEKRKKEAYKEGYEVGLGAAKTYIEQVALQIEHDSKGEEQ